MKYYYQYDICALIATTTLFIIYKIRARYLASTNRVFMAIVMCNGIASLLDLISCFTISYPEECSMTFNYIVSLGYLFAYNMLSVLYFAYIYLKAGFRRYDGIVKVVTGASIIFYAFTIFSSPWTHLVAYFDEDLNYIHGQMMSILYLVPIVMISWEVVIFFKAREKFAAYQIKLCIALLASMGISIFIPMFSTKLLIGQFLMAMILFYVYVYLENPAYYTYMDTLCLNKRAFSNDLYHLQRNDMIIMELRDLDYVEQNMESDIVELYKKKLADTLVSYFGQSVYNISDNIYTVITDATDKGALSKSREKIKNLQSGFKVKNSHNLKYDFDLYYVKDIDKYSVKEIELFTQYLKESIYTHDEGKAKLQEIRDDISRQNRICHIIEQAISNDKFQVYYQPIYDARKHMFNSAEALIRLYYEDIGFINPEELIIIAEKNGYIDQIGALVFEKVCKFISENNLREMGVDYIEINLSPKQCIRTDIVSNFIRIMEKYNVMPSQINLEVTETAETEQKAVVKENLHYFANLGMEISLDDYGSGYASPNYLIELPFAYVKIDKQILWAAMKADKAMVILQNIIFMLHKLGKKIIVEGVENEEMIEFLDKEKCEYYQGYYYSKPIPENDFINYIKEKNLIEKV